VTEESRAAGAPDSDESLKNGHSTALAWRLLLVTVAILCVVYFPIWLGRIVFGSDVAHWMFPARWFVRDSLLRGQIPGWNPFQGVGFPIFANPLYGVFYPPNWLTLLAPPAWVASLLTWLDFAHLVWGGVGMFLLARRLVRSPVAACVAALAWSLAGYNTSQWTAGLRMVAGAWVPWAAVGHLALLDSLRSGRRGWLTGVLKAALPTAFGLLAGEVFVTMMGVGFALATTAAAAVLERRRDPVHARLRARWLGVFALAPALAAGVAAVTLVPAYALKGSTERAAPLSRADAEGCSLHPARLVEFVAPDSMGNSEGFQPAARWIAEPGLDHIPLSHSLYMGASVIALVLAGFGRRRILASVLGALGGGALVLALGKYLPVHAVFRLVVFPFSYMRFPEKYTVVLVACFALLAALGTLRVLTAERQPWRRVVVLLGIILVLALLARFLFPGRWAGQVTRGTLAGGLAVAGVLTVQFLAARGAWLAPVLLIAIVGLDLAAATWPLQAFAPRRLATVSASAAPAVLADSPGRGEPPRLYRADNVLRYVGQFAPALPPELGELWLLQTFITNTANNWGIATLPGYDAAIPAAFDRIWKSGLHAGQSVLRLLGARYVLLPVDDPRDPKEKRTGIEPMLDPLPGTRLYRVPRTLPRVFLVGRAPVADDATVLRRILEPAVIAGSTAWLAPESGVQPLVGPADSPPGTCTLDSYSSNRLQASCRVQRPALAVFVEQYDKGWHATLDGQPAPILRANLIMRALAVGPGEHRIVMEFRTPGLRVGAVVTLLSLMLLLGCVAMAARHTDLAENTEVRGEDTEREGRGGDLSQ
jgi:Predicted membrane protein